MSMTVNSVGDNPVTPLAVGYLYASDQLIAGDLKMVTSGPATITGGLALPRGTVLGKVSLGASSSAAKAGGNTGGGALTLDVATPILANANLSGSGVYQVRCTVAAAGGGTFTVIDPKGVELGPVIINAGTHTVTFADRIKFALTAAGADYIVGDGFDVTIAAGSGKWLKSIATAVDGSQVPAGILVDDSDASAGDVNGGVYFTGEFNENRIAFDASWSVATLRDPLRAFNIFLKTAVIADPPT